MCVTYYTAVEGHVSGWDVSMYIRSSSSSVPPSFPPSCIVRVESWLVVTIDEISSRQGGECPAESSCVEIFAIPAAYSSK